MRNTTTGGTETDDEELRMASTQAVAGSEAPRSSRQSEWRDRGRELPVEREGRRYRKYDVREV